MKLRAIATKASFGLYDETGTRIATMNNSQIHQESRAQTIAHRVNVHDELVAALETLLELSEAGQPCGTGDHAKARAALERAKQ